MKNYMCKVPFPDDLHSYDIDVCLISNSFNIPIASGLPLGLGSSNLFLII